MKYETVKEAAERLGVTARTVQKWAAAGKIPGAMKVGRDWQIPVQKEEGAKKSTGRKHIPMPLLNSAFPLGSAPGTLKKWKMKMRETLPGPSIIISAARQKRQPKPWNCTSTVRMMHYGIRQRGSMPFPTLLVTRLP